jgi:hypothetical protein
METIDIIFAILTVLVGPYLIWDAYQDRKTK